MSETINPYPLLRQASQGDVEAMRTLASACAQQGVADGDLTAFTEALIFARLAFARTGEIADAGLTISTLAVAMDSCPPGCELRSVWNAEGIALASIIADQGFPFAEYHLPGLVEVSDEHAVQMSKTFVKLMGEE